MRRQLLLISLFLVGIFGLSYSLLTPSVYADPIVSIGASSGSIHEWSDMVITSDGLPLITYRNSSTGWRVVKCANTSCSSFSSDTAISNVSGTGGISMAIMSNTYPILVFDGTSGLTAYKCSNQSCTSGTETLLLSGTNYGQWPDVVVPSDNNPVISFNNNSGGTAMVYKCSNSTCTSGSSTTIYSASASGANSGITLSSDGLPFVIYGIDNTGLGYTKCGNAACTSGNSNGTIQTYTASSFPIYVSITRGTDNLPFMTYNFSSSGHAYSYVLRYTKCTNASCSTNSSGQITGSSDSAYYFKTAMGTDGFPVTVHGGANSVKVAKCNDASCSSITSNTIESATGSTPGGFNPAIAVNSSNMPIPMWINSKSPAGAKLMVCTQTNCAQSSAPSVTTSAAGSVTSTTATLNSSVNPNGAATTITYRYGTSNVACGSLPSTASYGSIGSGTSNVSPNAQGISSLTPSTTYYFCATANNTHGTVNGSVLNFTTSAGTPTIGSPTQASISYTTITLGGNVTSGGASSVTERGVCYSTSDNTPQLGEGSVTCQSTSGTTGVFTVNVTGLTHSTLYYYRAYATNSYGTVYTSTDNFTTLTIPPPTVALQAPTGLTTSEVTLNATANPNNNTTTGYFRVWPYNPGFCIDGGPSSYPGTGRHPIAGGDTLNGSTPQAFSHTVTNLISNKTYYYCAIAESAGGKSYHSTTPSSFTTPNGPANSCDVSPTNTITLPGSADCAFPGSNNITGADGVAMTLNSGATLQLMSGQTVVFTTISKSGASINKFAGGVMRKGCIYVKDADGDGRYDPSSATFSSTCPNATLVGQGFVRRKDLVGAPPYLSQTAECNDTSGSVTSPSCEPGNVAPSSVTNLAGTTATLNGVANPNGDNGTRAFFKWGSSNTGDCSTFASSTSATLITGTTNQNFSSGISGLTQGNTYYYCTVVFNNSAPESSPVYGDITSFVALGAPTGVSFSGVTQTNITVNWTPPAGAQGFKIYRCTGASCTPTTSLATDANNASPHSDTTVTCGNTYGYQVTATTGAGGTGDESVKSTIQYQASGSCSSAPSVTTNAASSITTTTASLNSTINPNSASTTVYYRWGTSNVACSSLPSSGTYGGIGSGSSPVSPNSYGISSLSQGTTYYYCAYASNSQGTTYGNVTSFTTPSYPQDLFTDTNGVLLENHTMNRGSGWSKLIDVGSGNINISSNTLRDAGDFTSAGELYQTNDTMPTNDYRVYVTMTTGDSSDDYNILAGRIQDANNMYAAKFNNTNSQIWRKSSGTWTQLGSTGPGIADGSVVALNLNGTNIALIDDGVDIISTSDSTFSSAGRAGVGIGAVITSTDDYSAQVLDSFEVGTALSCTNGYQDQDGDGYGSATYGCYITAVGSNTDCYDQNANARPGQTSYFTTDRGDGSYDYNCNSVNDNRTPNRGMDCSQTIYGGGSVWVRGGDNSCVSITASNGSNYRECAVANITYNSFCGNGDYYVQVYTDSSCATPSTGAYGIAQIVDIFNAGPAYGQCR